MIEDDGRTTDRHRRRGFRALASVVGAQGAGHLATVVWFLLAARGSEVEVFGSFSFAVSIVLILQVFIGAGMPQALVRFSPETDDDPRGDRRLRRLAILVPVLIGAATAAALHLLQFLGVPLEVQGVGPATWRLVVLCGAGAAVVATAAGNFQARGRPGAAALVGNAFLPLGLAAVFLFDAGELAHRDLMLRFTLIHGIGLAVAALLVLGRPRSGAGAPDGGVPAARVLAFGRHSLVIGLVYLGLGQVDRLMLGFLDTMEGVGLYSVPSRFARLLLVVLYIFPPLVGPVFARHLDGAREKALAVYRGSARLTALLVAPIALVLVLSGADLLAALAGPDYAAGSTLLTWLVAGVFLIASAGNNGLLLQMGGREKLEMRLSLLALGLNVALNAVLIPLKGPLGAAVATTVSYAVTLVFKTVLCHREYGVLPPAWIEVRLWLGAAALTATHYGLHGAAGLDWRPTLAVAVLVYVLVTRPWRAAAELAADWSAARPGEEAP